MTYAVIKAAHLMAMVTWLAGMTVVMVGLRRPHPALWSVLRSYDRRITTPAMILTWLLGLALAVQGGWLSSGWLWAKLVLVLGLSGLHGLLTGMLRRRTVDLTAPRTSLMRRGLGFGLAGAVAVILLVTTKPF